MTTLAVRNNNMGNLKDGSGNFQSFSDPVEGKAALYNDLTAKMTGTSKTGLNGDSSLLDFAKTYAPASDKNDPIQYAADIANKMGISPDTKIGTLTPRIDDFASAVASNEDPSITYKATDQPSDTPPVTSDSSTSTTPQTFEDYLKQNPNPNDTSTPSDSNPNLKATTGNKIVDAVLPFIPGGKLAQGLGYGLAAATGSQKGLIDANNQGIDIQGQLLAQIKKDKAEGKDTTKLEKAMKDLGLSLTDQANQISDVGTGGISNGEVLGSAASLAALPAASYLGGALSGGGIMNEGKGLVSGVLSKVSSGTALGSTVAQQALKDYGVGTMDSIGKANAITDAITDATAGEKVILQKALGELSPSILKEAGIGSFSELNPTIAKGLGLGGKALKFLVRAGADIAGLSALKGFIK